MPFLRTTRAALTFAAAALACAAPAAHAVAITETTYDVTVEAKVTYGHQWHLQTGERGEFDEETVDTVATVKTEIEDVLFRDGKIVNPGQWGLGDVALTGAGESIRRYGGPNDELETKTAACTPDGHSVLGRTVLDENPDGLEPLGPGERLTVRVAEGLRLTMPCTDGRTMDVALGDLEPFGQGLLDNDFDLPGEAIGMGTIIQLIHSTPAQEAADRCPGRNDSTTRCAYSWEGTVRFDRTDQRTSGQTPPAPQSKPQPDPPRAPLVPAEPPATDVDDLLAPLVPQKTASLKGRTLRFKAACPSGCSGTLTIAGTGARAAAVAKSATVVKFTVEPGKKVRTVAVKLNAKARAALRRLKKPAVKVTLQPKGAAKPIARTLTVEAAR